MRDTDLSKQLQTNYSKVVALAWSDQAFKAKLCCEPIAALAEVGLDIPEGVTIKVLENNNQTFHIVLPAKPGEDKVDTSEEEHLEADPKRRTICFCGTDRLTI